MKTYRLIVTIAGALGALVSVIQSAAASTYLIAFDNLSTGPCCYEFASPSPQTIDTVPATFTGGVILGNASNFPAIAYATPPNVYASGSASGGVGGFGLSETMSISINSGVRVNEVSFPLFNGMTTSASYVVNAYDGGTNLVASETLYNLPATGNSGYGIIDLINLSGITSVSVSPVGDPASWDYLIDTVAFNQPVGVAVSPVGLPPALPLFGSALIGVAVWGRRRRSPKGSRS